MARWLMYIAELILDKTLLILLVLNHPSPIENENMYFKWLVHECVASYCFEL